MKKSLFGLGENIVSAISYAGVFVTGILVLLFEKENKNVRFHALQSTIFFGALGIVSFIASFLLGWVPLVGWLIELVLCRLLPLVSWLFLTYSAYKGQMFKIPVLGDAIWEHINK